MNYFLKRLSIILAGVIMLSVFSMTDINADTTVKKVDILFTHDIHSHLNSFHTTVDGKVEELGGMARISTLIENKREENPDTLVLDAGDFSMGTFIQTLYDKDAAELRMLGSIGCDVTTIGNHEYDYRTDGLCKMLKIAVDSKDKLPEIVLANVDWETMELDGLTEEQKKLKEAFEYAGIKDYTIIDKGGIKIAVFGIFGKDALGCAPTCALKFKDPVKASKEVVEEIKSKEKADLIVCVSHSGTWEDEKKSEDEIIAKSVPDIDLIISGHTHSKLEEPICHGNTYIVSAEEYGKNLGSISMEQSDDGRWIVDNYKLLPITPEIEKDKETQSEIDGFMDKVDEEYLNDFGYSTGEVLAENNVVFTDLDDLSDVHEEHNLGSIIADAYKYTISNSKDYDGAPVDVTIVPSGIVRDTFNVGDITIDDVFNTFSLGVGPDGISGYPLVSVYLTGAELKTAAEVDASISDFMTMARLYMSGMGYKFNPHRLILNKVTDAYIIKDDESHEAIDNKKLYRVIVDLCSCQMLGSVTEMSKGLLSVVPKNADGTPIDDFEDAIIMEDGKELKAWDAIVRYMHSFKDEDGDGIPNVPSYYNENHERKIVEDSYSPISLLKNPNKFFAIIVGGASVVILIIILVIVKIRRKIKRRNHKKLDV